MPFTNLHCPDRSAPDEREIAVPLQDKVQGVVLICQTLYIFIFINRVQRILEKFRRSFEDTCYLTYDAPGCEPLAGHVPWSRIIEECVSYMMSIVQTQRDSGKCLGCQTRWLQWPSGPNFMELLSTKFA